jgi:RNA 2',3'-cyclic 3'-phosphodiesterase
MRLFVGIPLADGVTRELTALVAKLRSGGDGLRWSAPESWHITLQFLGNSVPEQLECLKTRLREVRWAPFAVEMGEPGFFDRAGVFFADVNVTPGLGELQRRVVTATNQCGFVAETRLYHPHITLARAAGNREAGSERAREQGNRDARARTRALRALKTRARGYLHFSRFTAQEFLLYESHLSPEGSRYEVRERFPLVNR